MQKRLEQLKHIVGHFNNEEAVKKMIENEAETKKVDQLAIKDLSDEEEDEEEDEEDKMTKFEQYKEEAKINITQMNSLLNK